MLQRWAKKKAAEIDARRWALVAPYMGHGEQRLYNTPCKVMYADGPVIATAYVTDRALIWAHTEGETFGGDRVEFEDIESLQPQGGSTVFVGFRQDEGAFGVRLELYPSPLSQQLWDELVRRATEARANPPIRCRGELIPLLVVETETAGPGEVLIRGNGLEFQTDAGHRHVYDLGRCEGYRLVDDAVHILAGPESGHTIVARPNDLSALASQLAQRGLRERSD